jgi:hypothetical protein
MKKNKEKVIGFLLGFLFLPVFIGKQISEPKSLEQMVKEAEKTEKPNDNRDGTGGWVNPKS